MKKLLLIRHAKATHETGFTDFERPLTHSGLRDAGLMAARLHDNSLVPEILVASPALRALTTANIFTEHLSLPQAGTNKRIYEAHEETLIDVVHELSNNHDFIGLVGHNPGFSQLLFYFTHEMREMETCATVLIEFDVKQWNSVAGNTGIITYYSSPNN